MEGIGTWIFLLILYLVSTLMKRRKQAYARRQLEAEEDTPSNEIWKGPDVLRELFGEPEPDTEPLPVEPLTGEEPEEYIETWETAETSEPDISYDKDISAIDEEVDQFESTLIHELSLKEDVSKDQFTSRRAVISRVNTRSWLFRNNHELRRGIIMKEVLGKPRALKRSHRA